MATLILTAYIVVGVFFSTNMLIDIFQHKEPLRKGDAILTIPFLPLVIFTGIVLGFSSAGRNIIENFKQHDSKFKSWWSSSIGKK